MFLKIGAMKLKAEEQEYEISVGYLIPDDEKIENPQIKPEFIYTIQKIVDDKLELVEPNDSAVFRQLDTTNGNLNSADLRNYKIWVAQYYKDLQYTGDYVGWQYSSSEHINGINGSVDVSMFK